MSISITKLRDTFDGRVTAPGDPGYDAARKVFYGKFDRRPAAVVRPADAGEVAQVVGLAAETGLELRCGPAATAWQGIAPARGGSCRPVGHAERTAPAGTHRLARAGDRGPTVRGGRPRAGTGWGHRSVGSAGDPGRRGGFWSASTDGPSTACWRRVVTADGQVPSRRGAAGVFWAIRVWGQLRVLPASINGCTAPIGGACCCCRAAPR